MAETSRFDRDLRSFGRAVLSAALVVLAASGPAAADGVENGSVKGKVIYRADRARPWRLGRYYIKNAKAGNLAEAVVALRGRELKTKNTSPRTVTIDQMNHQFTPETVAIQAGDTVRFTNSDPTVHNVKTGNGARPFNVNLHKGDEYKHTFQRGWGLRPIVLGCAFHGAMRAWIYVFDHPYFALTPASGEFELKNVPPGEYTLEMVHPAGDLVWERKIEVRAGQTAEVNIELSPDNKRKRE